ncbi:MAG: 4-hydroxy-3-methylbut-2-enyl diphosphate reductase [Candidatus Auribacterota bacterium]|nr:4-hydroxy-3-methylbut-2-enyl diphosphate reductase [Candidatus Auribacterota bacterium]
MKIIVAKNAGFCMGVRRALEMVLDRSRYEKRSILTYGPLIHNPQVVDLLSSKRVSSSRNLEDFSPDKVCFVSAHGISPAARGDLKATGARICDASCPDVVKVQGIIKKFTGKGYDTVIFGDRGHTEVEGLLGFTRGKGVVVNSVDDVERLPDLEKVCLVSQTTRNPGEYRTVADAVRKRFKEVEVVHTICSSTLKRQEEVIEMSRRVEAMVVVGGKNSANTARLSLLARKLVPVFQVETAEELDMEELGRYHTVGVTAGASTPNWLIQGVVDHLRGWSWRQKIAPLRWLYQAGAAIVKANIFIALGGSCLTAAAMRLLDIPLLWPALLLSFCLILSIYNLNIFADQPAILLNQPSRYHFFHHHRRSLRVFSAISLIAAFACAVFLGIGPLLLTVFTLLFGLAYSFTIFPVAFPGRRLGNLTGLKEIFSSLGWGVVAVLVPAASIRTDHPSAIAIIVAFIFVFSIMFVRSTLFAIRDIQGDRLVGRETLPVVLGVDKTKIVLLLLISLNALMLVLADIRGWVPVSGYFYLAVIAYGCGYLMLYHRRIVVQGLVHEVLVDGQLLLAGAIAFLS